MTALLQTNLSVSSEHFGSELLLIDLGHGIIVSDHPKWMNGTGKGPNPGELLKGALASSAVLAIGKAASCEGIALRHLAVGCGSDTRTERREDGPLPSTTTLSTFVLRVAVAGDLTPAQVARIEQIAMTCPVARALGNEVAIEERNVFDSSPARRDARGTTHLLKQMAAGRPGTGEVRVIPPEQGTRVFAEYLGAGQALVKWSESAYLVEDPEVAGERPLHGTQPEALLLAALAACTSVFVARSAALAEAAAEVRVECWGSFTERSEESDKPAVRIEKTLRVTGELDEKQRELLSFFGDNCAIGETLKRRATLDVRAELVGSGPASDRDALAAGAEEYLQAAICDDGSCCLPETLAEKA
jgi:uncharacterized OsmC-like protein